jgi:hypothetical protein
LGTSRLQDAGCCLPALVAQYCGHVIRAVCIQ